MSVNLDQSAIAGSPGRREPRRFPYSNWGAKMAILGVPLALATGLVLSVPAVLVSHPVNGKLSTGANIAAQFATEIGFLLVPLVIAARLGQASFTEALRRLGVRPFGPSALGWTVLGIGAYLVFISAYVAVFGSPHQEPIAKNFGSLPFQVLLIALAAPISEEICFRGMLFGGLRERLPRIPAALISGAVFGALHVLTGIGAVPPLIAFGFMLALLYEKTGSIIPGLLVHMLNNSYALVVH